jgi:hypothetical protein
LGTNIQALHRAVEVRHEFEGFLQKSSGTKDQNSCDDQSNCAYDKGTDQRLVCRFTHDLFAPQIPRSLLDFFLLVSLLQTVSFL